MAKRAKVRDAISELERQLNMLRIEEDGITKQIESHNELIHAATSGQQSEREGVDKLAETIETQRKAIDAAEEQLHTQQQSYETIQSETQGPLAKINECSQELRKRYLDTSSAIRQLENDLTTLEELQTDYEAFNISALFAIEKDELEASHTQLEEKRQAMKEETANTIAMQSSVAQLKKALDEIASRSKTVAQSKTTAVNGRDFLEAARFANELKELSSREGEVREQLATLEVKIKTQTELHDSLAKEFQEMQAKFTEREKTVDLKLFEAVKIIRAETRDRIIAAKASAAKEKIHLYTADLENWFVVHIFCAAFD